MRIKEILESMIIPDKAGSLFHKHANDYVKGAGLPEIKPEMASSSFEKQGAIAHAFKVAATDDPDYKKNVFKAYQDHHPDMVKSSGATDYDSLKKASYEAMEKETGAQYNHLSKHIKFDYHGGDKDYKDSNAMRDDLHNNHHLDVFSGGDRHEFLNKEDGDGVNSNHKFRAVHDAFGHGILKNGFGPKGEETAWHIHSQMYTPLARAAMTSETRGQNSYVNYSGINAGRSPKDTIYAPQKAVLLPPEMNKPDYNGEMPHYLKKHLEESYDDKVESLKRLRDHPNTPQHEKDAADRALGRIRNNDKEEKPIYADPNKPKESYPHHDVLIKHGYKHIGSSGGTHSYIKKGNFVNLHTKFQKPTWTSQKGPFTYHKSTGQSSEDLDKHLEKEKAIT